MDSTIPLVQLPSRAIKFVLKHFDVTKLILFSTLSNSAKLLVKCAKRKAFNIEVSVCHGCSVNLGSSTTIILEESLFAPCTVRVIEERPPFETSFFVPGFNGVRDWIVHFMYIFNLPRVDVIFGRWDEWKYSLESVKKLLKGVSIGDLLVFENACEIIRNFPIMNSLRVDKANWEPALHGADLKCFKETLIGNISRLQVNRGISIDLNTLLTMNSPNITIYRTSITEKELNTFLKLWLKGASRNLRRLSIDFVEHRRSGMALDLSVIMKGIKIERSVDEKKYCPRYDIRRRDGVLGDLIIWTSGIYFIVRS